MRNILEMIAKLATLTKLSRRIVLEKEENMNNILTITNLSKKYKGNERYSVKDLSFEVKEGELFAFLGPNGAGKSTTIKCTPPTS